MEYSAHYLDYLYAFCNFWYFLYFFSAHLNGFMDSILAVSSSNTEDLPFPFLDLRMCAARGPAEISSTSSRIYKKRQSNDIKPDNILIDNTGRLKLADFGLAKKASFLQRRKSNAIVSLWYRAPEIILGSEDYFLGVDMWSVGCIFAELMTKRPIFMCRNENEVLTRVF